jgi:hypothetical protein
MDKSGRDGYHMAPTPEQLENQAYARLVAEYGEDQEFMDALAVAWRLGFSRHMQLTGSRDPMMTVNPFWR